MTTIETARPVLKPLTDIIVVARPMPLANVYSVGDLLIVVGLVGTLVWILRQPGPPSRVEGANAGGRQAIEASATVPAGT